MATIQSIQYGLWGLTFRFRLLGLALAWVGLVTLCCGMASNAMHVAATVGDLNLDGPGARAAFADIHSIIDNDLRVRPRVGGHRVFGHWGFSDSIPFDAPGPLRDHVAKYPQERERIIALWSDAVKRMTRAVEDGLALPHKQAQGLAGLVYDHHILADYLDQEIGSLQDMNRLRRDLVRNMNELLGRNTEAARAFRTVVNAVSDSLPPKEAAQALLDVLTEHSTGKHMKIRYAAQLADNGIEVLKTPSVGSSVKAINLSVANGMQKPGKVAGTVIEKVDGKAKAGVRLGRLIGMASGISDLALMGYWTYRDALRLQSGEIGGTYFAGKSFLRAASTALSIYAIVTPEPGTKTLGLMLVLVVADAASDPIADRYYEMRIAQTRELLSAIDRQEQVWAARRQLLAEYDRDCATAKK